MKTYNTKAQSSTGKTMRAARGFTRRTMLKGAVAAGAALGAGPWIVKDALSSSGELKVMMWPDYLTEPVTRAFEKATGIKIKQVHYGSNEELLNRLAATRGRGYDLVSPTSMHMGRLKALELLQPWDMERVPTSRMEAPMLDRCVDAGNWNSNNYYLPFVWGTEGLAWRTDKWSASNDDVSYGDLWKPGVKGKIMGRAHSLMLCIGLYLDRIGELPSNRMMDTYKDEDAMRAVWDVITEFAIDHKSWLKHFWKDASGQINGFRQNGVILGQTWDGPPTRLRREGEPITYRAPVEGALAWIDGLSMPVGARNIDQVYAFLDFIHTPRNGARLANESGYISCALGSTRYLNKTMKKKLDDAYSAGAFERLWWWPVEEPWYVAIRAGYRDKFIAA